MGALSRTPVISLESSCGAGKGFFIKYIKHVLSDVYVWLSDDVSNMSNMLDFCNDQNRWSLFTELDFLSKRVQIAREMANLPLAICSFVEGSVMSDRYCYAKYMFDKGCMTDAEYKLYLDWFAAATNDHRVDAVIYLEADVQVSFERVVGNCKREQCSITPTELAKMKYAYDSWIDSIDAAKHPENPGCVPVIRVKCGRKFEDNAPIISAMVLQVVDALKNLGIIRGI